MKKESICPKCSRAFKNVKGLRMHDTKAHPYVPPPAPKKTIETDTGDYESRTLLGGHKMGIGDVVWVGRKAVITKLTRTEGSKDLVVTLRITKRWWSADEIS